jgi:cell filamentation protein
MNFDPFGDFETRGYLRNTAGLKVSRAVKEFEHRAFLDNLPRAVAYLQPIGQLTYQDMLETHRILFQSVCPWAGLDRSITAPTIAIGKAGRADLFAHPHDSAAAVDYALRLGQDREFMSRKPGEVMGYLAHGHPFLDGNGRTLMVVHNELAHRAGISIAWHKTDRKAYLRALTEELNRPGKGELDAYLKPFVGTTASREDAAKLLAAVRGLG